MAADVHREFLEFTGFEKNEIPEYLPLWRKASEKLGLSGADISFAMEQWIPRHFDVKLKGVRKMIGAWIREAIDLTRTHEYKEQGMKSVYGILPAHATFYYAFKMADPDNVFVSFPDIHLVYVLNAFFHRLNPYLDGAEKAGMLYGCRHCALNKTRFWSRRSELIASPSVSWLWSFVCDEAAKTDEFIHDSCAPDWKTLVTTMPHDQPLGTREDEVDERVEYLAAQMKDSFESVQQHIGLKVPEEKIKAASDMLWLGYAPKLEELLQLVARDPQPLSGEEVYFFAEPLQIPFNTGIETMEKALDILIGEVKERVAKGEGILPKGAPKLMSILTPAANPWIVKMFEECGVGVPFPEGLMPSKKELQPSRFEDPYMAAAESWLKYSMTVNVGYKCEIICEKIETYGVDGMLLGFLDFDRWLGSDHRLLSKMVEEKTGVPAFYIEGDIWEDRDYSPEALRTRIETVASVVKMRKS